MRPVLWIKGVIKDSDSDGNGPAAIAVLLKMDPNEEQATRVVRAVGIMQSFEAEVEALFQGLLLAQKLQLPEIEVRFTSPHLRTRLMEGSFIAPTKMFDRQSHQCRHKIDNEFDRVALVYEETTEESEEWAEVLRLAGVGSEKSERLAGA